MKTLREELIDFLTMYRKLHGERTPKYTIKHYIDDLYLKSINDESNYNKDD